MHAIHIYVFDGIFHSPVLYYSVSECKTPPESSKNLLYNREQVRLCEWFAYAICSVRSFTARFMCVRECVSKEPIRQSFNHGYNKIHVLFIDG